MAGRASTRRGESKKALRGLVVLTFPLGFGRPFLHQLLRGLAGQFPRLVRFAASLIFDLCRLT
jgi:hypothetical protein